MAPTQVLAKQHYETMQDLLGPYGIEIVFLFSGMKKKERTEALAKIADGTAQMIVGTHSCIANDVNYHKLALTIVDEEHKFGVAQRSKIIEKAAMGVHNITMSATPIPRTLALIMYGDLDISVLDEMPKGRQVTETYAVNSKLRKRAYTYVKKHLDSGFQAYIVCPMIEEGELELASANKFYEKLKDGFFKNYKLGLLHGKMKPNEKEAVMKSFANGEIDLLVATTVIEVGVDVPNANIMVIENAERFGLSQLHQLRGRVGRGKQKATCILISDAETQEAKKRLEIMCKTADGFKIADEDLRLRGPGDFFGSRQHGLPTLKIASILTDRTVLKQTSALARQIIKDDKNLEKAENIGLQQEVKELFENYK